MNYGQPVYPAYVAAPPSPGGYVQTDQFHASRLGSRNPSPQPNPQPLPYSSYAPVTYGGGSPFGTSTHPPAAGSSPYRPAGYIPASGGSPYHQPTYLPGQQQGYGTSYPPQPYAQQSSPYRPPTYLPGGNSPDPYHSPLPPTYPAPPSPRSSYPAPPSPRSTYPASSQGSPTLLHPLLAYNQRVTPVDWDMRTMPSTHLRIPSHFQSSELVLAATVPPARYLRLVSPLMPWSIIVDHPATVSVMQVFDAIHLDLQKPITQAEWRIANERHREKVTEAYTHRCQAYDNPDHERSLGIKRIDWLVKSTRFAGLRKDDDGLLNSGFTKDNLMPYTFMLICTPR